jgi:DNA (cytosine-5)-methyltransferase 1
VRVLDLFAGIGGFSLGLEAAGFETVAFCEYDKAAQKVLKLRWPNVPIFDDIRGLDESVLGNAEFKRGQGGEIYHENNIETFQGGSPDTSKPAGYGSGNAPIKKIQFADVITGGYPCQPFSAAGKRRGAEDDRHLWPEMYRIIKIVRPQWVIAENVAGHVSMGLDSVLSDMEAENYTCWPFIIPACAVDAKHRRDRVWIICHSKHDGSLASRNQQELPRVKNWAQTEIEQFAGPGEQQTMGNSDGTQCERGRLSGRIHQEHADAGIGSWREAESRLGRELNGISAWLDELGLPKVSSGVPKRADRLKQLGNAVVPQIPYIIGRAIMEAES